VKLGPTHLTVSDLDRSAAFYQDAVGLRVHRREDGVAALGAGAEDVLVLTEQPGARPPGRHAGLYHVALLYPSREELAQALHRVVATQTTGWQRSVEVGLGCGGRRSGSVGQPAGSSPGNQVPI
jgi:catechol 2,3-dioxygenase